MDDWSWALAREFAPYEELIAEETVRRYVEGGRSRRALLRSTGEGTGGFDGSARSGDLVHILEALNHCGHAVLAVLEHPAVAGASDADGALIALIELRRARRTRERETEPTEVQVTIDVSPQAIQAVDQVLEQLTGQLASRREDQDAAWDEACRLLHLLARDPENAAGFVRGLDPSLRQRPAGRWHLAWRRFPRFAFHGADPDGIYTYDDDPDGPAAQVRWRLLQAPALDREQVRRAGRHPRAQDLIQFVDDAGQVRIPAFQVDADMPVPVVLRINRLLGADQDPWGVADWWLRRNTRLDAAPATLIGLVPDAVLLGCAEAVLR